MRIRKIVISAAIMAGIITVNSSVAAAAASRQGRMSGPAAATIIKSDDFAGYSTGAGTDVVKATIKVPQATCSSSSGLYFFSPGVYVLGPSGVTGGGLNVTCDGGSLTYQAQVDINSGPQDVLFTINPGDTITVTASETVAGATVTVKDLTSKASGTDTGAGDGVTSTLVGAYASPPIPTFTKASFSKVTVGSTGLGSNNPVELEMVSGTLVLMAPNAISNGKSFAVLLKNS